MIQTRSGLPLGIRPILLVLGVLNCPLWTAVVAVPAWGQESPVDSEPAREAAGAAGEDSWQGVQDLVRTLVLEHMPHQYENTKRWGGTKEVFDGLRISQQGLRLKTKRRKKEVPHGTWKRYRIDLLEPHEELQVQVENVRELGNGRLGFETVFVTRLKAFGRLSQWERGVQLVSLSAEADAKVHLRVSSQVGMRLDISRLPPDVILDAEVTDADLQLIEFRLRRISDLHGPLVKQLGRGLREVLDEKLQQNRHQLAEKINRQIAKNEHHLRFSLHDRFVAKWQELKEQASAERAPDEQRPPSFNP